jgi:hypothetical protein
MVLKTAIINLSRSKQMPKKTKKQTRKTPAMAETSPIVAPSVTTSAFAPPITTAGRTSDADFNPDYTETKKDLKRIGILASSFFVLLIILSFFLR